MENGYNFIPSVTTLLSFDRQYITHTHTPNHTGEEYMHEKLLNSERKKAFSITCAKSWKTIIYAALIFNEDIDLYIR